MNRDLLLFINFFLVPVAAGAAMFGQMALFGRWLDTRLDSPPLLISPAGPIIVALVATLINLPFLIHEIRKESTARGITVIVMTVLVWAFAYFMGSGMAIGLA